MRRRGRSGVWSAAGLLAAVACAGLVGCSDGNSGSSPSPTATGGAAATRTPTHAAATATQGGNNATATPTRAPAQPTFTRTPESGEPTATAGAPTQTPGGGNATQAKVEKFVSSILGGLSGLGAFALPASVASLGGGAFDFPPIDIPMDIPPTTVDCSASGQQTLSCTTAGGKGTFKIQFANCHNAVVGGEAFLDGLISVALPGSCFLPEFGNDKPFDVVVNAAIDTMSNGDRVAGTFDLTEVVTQRPGNLIEFSVDGTAATDCVGQVALQTLTPITIPTNGNCARAGALAVTIDGDRSAVRFTDGGGLDIDLGDNGSVEQSYNDCSDPAVDTCS